jgi:hypothetical protein
LTSHRSIIPRTLAHLSVAAPRTQADAALVTFGHGHALRLSGCGKLIQTASPELRQGVAVWVVEGGDGQFADANGRITSNLLLSQTGELTDGQLGIVFARRASFTTTRRAPEHREPPRAVRLTV